MIKTTTVLAEHIVVLYAKIEDLTNRLADLEGRAAPPWEGDDDFESTGT